MHDIWPQLQTRLAYTDKRSDGFLPRIFPDIVLPLMASHLPMSNAHGRTTCQVGLSPPFPLLFRASIPTGGILAACDCNHRAAQPRPALVSLGAIPFLPVFVMNNREKRYIYIYSGRCSVESVDTFNQVSLEDFEISWMRRTCWLSRVIIANCKHVI